MLANWIGIAFADIPSAVAPPIPKSKSGAGKHIGHAVMNSASKLPPKPTALGAQTRGCSCLYRNKVKASALSKAITTVNAMRRGSAVWLNWPSERTKIPVIMK